MCIRDRIAVSYTKVLAQEVAPLVVAPARQSLSVDPGKSVSFGLRFYNTSGQPITGAFRTADFIVEDNQGTPKFIDDPTLLSNRYAAASWVSLSTERGTISGDGMVTINGTARVPSDARPGGRYFAVFFEPDTEVPGQTGGIQQEAASVTLRLAGLVYLRVNGPISEGANIVRFSAPGFSEFGPVAVTTEIKNNGDYHIAPSGTITVKDIFGRVVAKTNLSEANIFPDSSRVTTTKVGPKWMIGKFTANLDAKYGETGKMLTASLAFWVFPWKLAILVLLIVAIIGLAIYLIVNKYVKKEKKLEAELKEEKTELEALKTKLEDQIKSVIPHETETPEKEDKP
jgi:hypothetical protein